MAEAGITRVADVSLLKSLWRRSVRDQLRTPRLQDFEIGHDPLEGLAFDWELDAAIASLSRDLLSGEYRAGPVEVIRAAKGRGLTRPLAFMRPVDILVYKALVSLAETELMKSAKPWTRFGRSDASGQGDGSTTSDSGWFRDWLKRDGQIWRMTETHEWLIETDISNFFPSIHVELLLGHVQANSNLSEDAVKLLGHILTMFAPLANYRLPPTLGLPQENYNSSRVLAHTFLKTVDDEFDAEGRASRYSRWMDDIVVGVDSKSEALPVVNRIQKSLAILGLYPNAAKTRVYSKQEFALDYMKDENDFLGEIAERWQKSKVYETDVFHARLRQHLRSKKRGYRAWERVLRRYYTAARTFRDPILMDRAFLDIEETASSAKHIFEYLASFPLTLKRIRQLQESLSRLGGVYEDVELLAHEYVCSAPNLLATNLGDAIADWGMSQIAGCLTERSVSYRLGAAACLSIGKFGNGAALDQLHDWFQGMRGDTVLRQQALVVLVGADRIHIEDVNSIAAQFGRDAQSHLAFLSALARSDERALRMTIGFAHPKKRGNPPRWQLRTRALFLSPVVARLAPSLWSGQAVDWRHKLKTNARAYRDAYGQRWLFNLAP